MKKKINLTLNRDSEFVKKYSDNVVPVEVATGGGVSGTLARKLFKTDIDGFRNMFPENLLDTDFDKILDILNNKSTDNTRKSTPKATEPLTPLNEGDPKKGTGKKPKGSGRRLYTDEDPKDTVGIKFSTRQDIVDTLNKKSFKAKSHARQSQIINLIHQRVRAAYGRAKDPAVKKRLKTGLDYITGKKEASKKKTERLKKQKSKNENIDPKSQAKHKGKSAPFGSAYEPVTEIDYDSIFRTEAYLKTNISQRSQGDILSDIRSLPGVTIVGSKEVPNRPSREESILSIKVDPYPFTKMDDVSAPEAVDYISSEIRKINGVERFQILKKRVSEGDTYEKMAAKGKKAGSLKQGTVRKRLKIPKDKKIPLSLINKELSRLKKMDKDKDKKGVQLGDKNQKYYKALQLSKTLKTTTNINEVTLIRGKDFGKDKLKEITPIIFLSHDNFKENEIKKLKKDLDSDPYISSRYVGIAIDLNKFKTDKGIDFNKLIKAGNSIVNSIKNQLKNKFSKLDPVVYVGYNPKNKQIKDISGNKFIILNRLGASDIVTNSKLQFRRGADEMAAAMDSFKGFGGFGKMAKNMTKENLNENATYSSKIDYKQQIKDLTKHMIKKGMNILPLPKVIFKHGDQENASQFLGKTAYYSPEDMTVVLYTEGRHPKDIVRSFSHEMIHHIQNLEDRLHDISTTNTMEDDHLNDIEREAYTRGNMVFRNWTDNMDGEEVSSLNEKKKDPFGLNQYARELVSEVFKKSVTIDMDPILKTLEFEMPTGQETDENVIAIIDAAPAGKVPHPVFLDFYAKFDKYFGEKNDNRMLDNFGLEYLLSNVLNLPSEDIQIVMNHYNTTDQDSVEWFEQHDNELERDEEYNIPGFDDVNDDHESVVNYRRKQLAKSLEEQEKVRIFNPNCGCDKA